MSEIFNFKRFGSYAVRSWGLYWRKYLVTAGVEVGAMILLMATVCGYHGHELRVDHLGNLTPWYIMILIIYVYTFTVVTMNPFKNKNTLVMENTAPSSITEKWFFVLVNSTVVAAVIFLLAALAAVLTGVVISGSAPFVEYFHSDYHMRLWGNMPVALLPFQAAVMYAGTMERRSHRVSFLLVCATLLAAFLTFIVFPMWLSERFDMDMMYGTLFMFGFSETSSDLSSVVYSGSGLGVLRGNALERAVNWGGTASAILFWVCAWFNFRERSIK